MEVDPGNFSLLFKPVFISTSPVCPAAVYLYNCLCGLFPSSATKTWLYFMLIFSLFLLVFFLFVARVYCPLPPLSANTPFLGFFKVFPSHARTSISPTRISVLWRLIFMPMLSFCQRRGQGGFFAGSGCDGSRSGRFLLPESLLLSVISSCFWRSARLNKMAACCFYSSDTRGKGRRCGGGRETLGVNGGGRERRGESSWVFGTVRKSVPCSFFLPAPGVDR